jgi:hypothetical protein
MLGMIPYVIRVTLYTDKKENKIFLIYLDGMRKFYPIYEEALVIHDFASDPSYFLIYEDNLFDFLSVCCTKFCAEVLHASQTIII